MIPSVNNVASGYNFPTITVRDIFRKEAEMKRLLSIIAIWFLLCCVTGCSSSLMRSVKNGDVTAVKNFVKSGADLSERHGILGMTPLMHAARKGNREMVTVLLDNGSSVNAQATTGSVAMWTALSFAAAGGHVDIVKLLLEKGADIDMALIGLEREAARFFSPDHTQAQLGIRLIQRVSKKMETAAAHQAISGIPKKTSHAIMSDVDVLPLVQAQPRKNAYAIVIGIEKYRQQLPAADYAERDARTVAEYLSKVMGYPEDHIVRLLNDHATKSDMKKYLEKWIFNNVEKGGTVFVYFSGHGAPDTATGDVFLVPYDGDPTFIDETGYSLNRLYKVLEKLPAKEIIIAIDSCFSGAGGRSVLAKGARPLVMTLNTAPMRSDRIAVLSASSGSQISSTYEEKGHGLFTYFLLKGIKEGHAELGNLYSYLKPQVRSIALKQYNNEQIPALNVSAALLNLRLYER